MNQNILSNLSKLKDERVKYLLVSTFLIVLSTSILNPVRSIYISSFGISLLQLGLLFTITIIVSVLMDSPFGTLCDHFSRKKILILSIILSILVLFFQTIANSFITFFLIFILKGFALTAYNISVWSYMQEVIGKTKIYYPIISVFWIIAGIIGPYIGGFIGESNNVHAFYACMICEAFALLFAFKIPHLVKKTKTLKQGLIEAIDGVYVDEFKSFIKTNNNVKISTLFDVTLNYDINVFYNFLPVYMNSFFGLGELWIGAFFSIIEMLGLIVRVLEFLFFKKIIKKRLIITSAAITGACYLLIPFVNSLALFIALLLVASFFSYIIYPLTYQLFINSLPRKKKGEVIGMNMTIYDLGGALGNFAGGIISSTAGVPAALFSSAFLYLTSSGVASFIKRSSKRQAEVDILLKKGRKQHK